MKNRIKLLEQNEASEKSQKLLDQIQQKNGSIANVFKMMANAPAVLQSYLSFSGALASGKLDKKIQERIALQVAELSECNYCLAAHSTIAKGVGLSEAEILRARNSESEDARAQAALDFSRNVLASGGNVADAPLENIREAGFSDEEILEIIAAVSLNTLTNTLNNVAQTELDFPRAKENKVCCCCG